MNYKDIRTLEHALKEYGLKPGPATPPGAQKFGTSSTQSQAAKIPPANKPPASPTTRNQKQDEPETAVIPAADLEVGTKFMGKKPSGTGEQEVEVVKATSPGDTNIVVKTPDDEFEVIDTRNPSNKNVAMALPQVQEDSSLLTKSGRLKRRLGRTRNKLKHLIRSRKFGRQGSPLFEINFNSAEVIKSALDAPISCGFEAETVWSSVDEGAEFSLEGLSYSDIEDLIRDQNSIGMARQHLGEIREKYDAWLTESDAVSELYDELLDRRLEDELEDDANLEEFIGEEVSSSEVNTWREFTQEHDPKEYRERMNDGWDDDNWARDYVNENRRSDYVDWMRDQIRNDDADIWDEAYTQAANDNDIDDWVQREYRGHWELVLDDLGIYIEPDSSGGLTGVAEHLEAWSSGKSSFKEVRTGDYHEHAHNVAQDFWRVEPDGSIDGDGVKAEIISPVYSTPRAMLREMFALFEYFNKNDVETNESTGLHITMSMSDEVTGEVNKLKLVLLLGDQYVLDQFDRRDNSYTSSQMDRIQRRLSVAMSDEPDDQSLSEIESLISRSINPDKFTSVNFKNIKNSSGNPLIEFRVAGNADYHTDTDKLAKTVVRYAATMQAAYDPAAYRKDYIKAIQKLMDKARDGVTDKELKDTLGGEIPATDLAQVVKTLSTREQYLDNLDMLKTIQKNLDSNQEQYARENFIILMVRIIESLGRSDTKLTTNTQLVKTLRQEFKRLGVTGNDMAEQLYKRAMAISSATPREGRGLAKYLIDILQKLIVQKVQVPGAEQAVTIRYNPEVQRALIQLNNINRVLDGKEVQMGTEDIKIVDRADLQSYQAAKNVWPQTPDSKQVLDNFRKKYGIDVAVTADTKPTDWIPINRVVSNELSKIGIDIVTESAFDKLDKLPLQEQLEFLRKIPDEKINRVWKKLRESAYEKPQALPVHNVPKDLEKLLSKPLLASDIKSQMAAYIAVPDPSMIKAFRDRRVSAGDDADLRDILRSYVELQVHPKQRPSSQSLKENALTESRGVTARNSGETYVSMTDPDDVLTIQNIVTIPEENSGIYELESLEDLNTAIAEIVPDGESIVNDNEPKSNSRAAIVVSVTDAQGNPQHWVRYLQKIPPGGTAGLWKTLRGYKYGRGAATESVPIKPSDLLSDEKFRTVQELETELLKNLKSTVSGTEYQDLYEIFSQAIMRAKNNSSEPIAGAQKYDAVLTKYAGELLGPINLVHSGNLAGDTAEMLSAYGIGSLKGSTIQFPQDVSMELIDSKIKTPDGTEIGISSKIHKGGGAASSLSGIYNQMTDEIREQHPEGSEIIEILATQSAIAGPIKLAEKLNIVNKQDLKDLDRLIRDRAETNIDSIKSKNLKNLVASQAVSDADSSSYRLLYHALTAIVNALVVEVNQLEDFRSAVLKTLNNNNFLQLLTKSTRKGDDLALSYYTKYPMVFDGYPVLFNKSYFSTGQKGRLGFKLVKNKAAATAPAAITSPVRADARKPVSRPGSLATKKAAKKPAQQPSSTGLGRDQV
jgi:hypothetical protein